MRRTLLFFFNHRFIAIARWELHFLRLRCWNSLSRQRARIGKDLSGHGNPVFLNLGAGPRGREDAHWINVDGYRDRGVRYLIDFTRPLPFSSGSFNGAFCEHVLEHFCFDEGVNLAAEVYRILQPGGSLRVIVPDAELIMRRYFDKPSELVAKRGMVGDTPMEVVNTYFRQRYEHQFLYDWTTMKKMLQIAGFDQVARVSFGRSAFCEPLLLDDQKYEWESLYVEARKGR
jgi:predicted SAM-dependent methyltransferase